MHSGYQHQRKQKVNTKNFLFIYLLLINDILRNTFTLNLLLIIRLITINLCDLLLSMPVGFNKSFISCCLFSVLGWYYLISLKDWTLNDRNVPLTYSILLFMKTWEFTHHNNLRLSNFPILQIQETSGLNTYEPACEITRGYKHWQR